MVKYTTDPESIRLIRRSFKLNPTSRKKKFSAIRQINRREAPVKPVIGKDKCPICLETFNYAPQLDHCHYSGATRDYLCIRCNTGLGKFFDSSVLLKRCMNYIDKYDPRFEAIKKSMLETAKTNGGVIWSSAW